MTSRGAEPLPRAVAWLGYGGLLPFVALAAASVAAHLSGKYSAANPQQWNAALLAYGAAILSFVGALHWGFAMTLGGMNPVQRSASFVWSVVPALVAWLALLTPPMAATALLVAGFCLHYAQDCRLAAHADLPGWYLPMRLRLTAVTCLCLCVGVIAALLQPLPGA